jgi:precorrin-4/cobalt-precorrin-4 C11-methyltransferase
MKVYFIGAGPGAPDLITVRGAEILAKVPIVLYAGSLVPSAVLKYCQAGIEIIDTASVHLDDQMRIYERAMQAGQDVARVHSGDPAIYGATAEQMQRLEQLGVAYEIVPGVSSFTAAAASLGVELTRPGISQTIILTRVSGRASAVPDEESLAKLASHKATICVFLSGPHLSKIVSDLRLHYLEDTPVALVYRASTPEERIHRSTLSRVLNEVDVKDWKLTTMLIVGDVLRDDLIAESQLYSSRYSHLFRRAALSGESL